MSANSLLPPFPLFTDTTGQPLEGGYIYIGQPGLEARSNPKASFFNVGLTIPTGTATGAAIRTTGGYPSNNGAPAMVYVDEDFSITVTDRNDVLLYSTLNRTFALSVGSAGPVPIQAPDGNLGTTGFGFLSEVNTGLIRSAPGVMQLVALGVPAAQITNTGIVLNEPLSGPGVQYPFEEPNGIINSDFAVSQRGAGSALTSTTGRINTNCDRWFMENGVNTQTISFEALPVLSQIGHIVAKFIGRVITTLQSTATSFARIDQRIEGARTYSGQTITIFGWGARSSAGNISVGLLQNFGTGGSPSASVTVNAVTVALGTAAGPWKVTFAVPSVIGKTFGTNNNDFLEVRIFTSAGASVPEAGGVGINNVTVDLFGIHIRPGDVNIEAINFYQTPDPHLELARCQRYYCDGTCRFDGNIVNTIAQGALGVFPVEMRAVPAVTGQSTAAVNFPATFNDTQITRNSFVDRRSANSTGGGNFGSNFQANAEL
jgi:hypothetical protein